jgi:aspartyl-tRNA(Asn)/glutamyl-tRNA(Gln) amidotransferase subunit A
MTETARALAHAHRTGKRDPRETAQAAIARAHETQAGLNAFASIANDPTIPAAAAHGKLAGVPVSVKDILDAVGLPTRWGSNLTANAAPATSDIAAVARLRAAGAVIIGKTTTTEFAHSPLGTSPLTGLTRNPRAPALTCGGSSAGAGASVAAGITPIALATDAGCSTRLPAACCGIYGFKPSLGAIPHERVPDGFGNFVHLGLLARDPADLDVMFNAVAGPHRADPHSLFRPAPTETPANLAGARVLVWLRTGNALVSEEMVQATHHTIRALIGQGAEVTEEDYTLFNPNPAWITLQQVNWAARFATAPAADRALLSDSFNAGIDAGTACDALTLNRAAAQRTQLFRAVQTIFDSYDFILTPCTSTRPLAASHDLNEPLMVDGKEAGDLRTEWTPYLSLFDLSGHPAIALPALQASDGTPLGTQLVAPLGADSRLLSAAAALAGA